MIDGLIKDKIDPLWESLATPLVRLKMTPNQVTFAGLVLVSAVCAAYIWHGSALIFGATLAVAFTFDALDGAVARRRNMCSIVGGYFDAIVDRYQELVVFATIAYVNDLWPLALLALTGGVFTSYAKARTAIEMPISNTHWPDLFERLERVIFLCAVLLAQGTVDALGLGASWILPYGVGLYAVLAHATALQRALRAARMLRVQEQETLNRAP